MMAKIYKYKKITDQWTTHCLVEPDYNLLETEEKITELCTIDGYTYVSVPDNISLPPQPKQITVEMVVLTPELSDAIKAASPHIMLINDRVVERIRKRYSVNDEIKMLRNMIRIGQNPETEAYNAWADECREMGQNGKAKLMG
jgi:hypothetical protein